MIKIFRDIVYKIKDMKLGTHNSMSYLPVKKWYLAPFKFIAKCQSICLKKQYELGARLFDLRVSFDKYNNVEFRHGYMAFKGDVFMTLEYLNSLRDDIYVRVILENDKPNITQSSLFRNFCTVIETYYKNIQFFAGNRKCDWKVIYKFKVEDLIIEQKVSSMQGSRINGIWPWLYAKLHNKKSYKEAKKNRWILMDFIEIR